VSSAPGVRAHAVRSWARQYPACLRVKGFPTHKLHGGDGTPRSRDPARFRCAAAAGGTKAPGTIEHTGVSGQRVKVENRDFQHHNINKRLANLVAWLERSVPDVVCLQELKAEQTFPESALRVSVIRSCWKASVPGTASHHCAKPTSWY
jgi:hypothetical protein